MAVELSAAPVPLTGNQPRRLWLEALLVFAVFAASASIRSPVPGVNEPHYLTKAKNLWDPQWCPRDLFLNSANAHAVFLYAFGALTRVLTLEQTAWVGRVLVWLSLALGWVRLVRTLTLRRYASVWSAAVYVAIAACGSYSGEWIVGGVESKGFAYAALLAALADAGERRWLSCAIWSGAATALHPVVGGWGTLAILIGGVANQRLTTLSGISHHLDWRRALVLTGTWFVCSAPGLFPAIRLVISPGSAELADQAAKIQVFQRLAHHLDPQAFTVVKNVCGFVWLLSFAGLRFALTTPSGRLLRWATVSAILIAEVGLILGWGPRPASLLKFYFFRLADGWLPIVIAMALVVWLARWPRSAWLGWLLSGAIWIAGLLVPVPDRGPTGIKQNEFNDWREMCSWVKQSTPRDALILTPRSNYAFRWYAERAEYAFYKDCPQDAASLVEWNRRVQWVRTWREQQGADGYTAAGLAALYAATEVDFVVAKAGVLTSEKPVFENSKFAVYATH